MSPTPKLTPLRALGLRKRYGQTTVVEDVGLSVRPGEVLGLLGPNGAGKTTTFYMLVGLVRPVKKFALGEAVITREPIHARAKRGIACPRKHKRVPRAFRRRQPPRHPGSRDDLPGRLGANGARCAPGGVFAKRPTPAPR